MIQLKGIRARSSKTRFNNEVYVYILAVSCSCTGVSWMNQINELLTRTKCFAENQPASFVKQRKQKSKVNNWKLEGHDYDALVFKDVSITPRRLTRTKRKRERGRKREREDNLTY